MAYDNIRTGFRIGPNNQDLGQRFLSKDYLLDLYPNIASNLGARTTPGLFASGDNTDGTLGNNSSSNLSSPVQIASTSATWKKIQNGSAHSVAIKSDGTLWAWGRNNNGQLGSNSTTYISSPVQIGSQTNWMSIGAGTEFTHYVRTNGGLWFVGLNAKY